jgi:hypothetical protein
MNRVFVDTSAIVAIFDRRDFNHANAKRTFEKIYNNKINIIITDYILDECVTTIMGRAGHDAAVRAGEFILNSKVVELIWLDEQIKLKTWDFFKKYSDKEFSFTDCTSFVLMKDMKIRDYFAFDEDFKITGLIDVYDTMS